MPGDVVGRASIIIEADTDTDKFEAEAVKVAEKAGNKAGAGFSDKFDKQVTKGGKEAGKSLSSSLTPQITKLDNAAKKAADRGLSSMLTAAASLGPSLIPILGAATVATLSLGAALAGAGAAGGVFGAVFKSSFTDLKKQIVAQDGLNKTIDKYQAKADAAKKGSAEQATALKNVRIQQSQLKDLIGGMSGPEQAAAEGFDAMKTAWANFKEQNQGMTLGIMTRGFNLIVKVLPLLQPLFNAGANAISHMLTTAERWVGAGGLKGLIDFLAKQATAAIPLLNALMGNLARTFGALFRATSGGPSLLAWLVKLSAAAAGFAVGGGFERFVDAMGRVGPAVGSTLGSLATSLGHISQAIFPLAPLSLAFAQALGILTSAIPVPVLTIMLGLIIGLNLGFKLQAVSLYAAAAATRIYAAGQWLANSALLAFPLTWVIAGMILMGAGLVLLWKKSDTFRAIVTGAWDAIKGAVMGAVTWITGTAVPWVVGAWNAIVGGVKAMVSGVVGAWNTVMGVLRAVGSYLNDVFGPTFRTLAALVTFQFKAMEIIILAFWQFVVKPVLNQVIALAISVGGRFVWLWKSVAVPVFNGISTVVQAAWTRVIKPVFSAIISGAKAVGGWFSSLWHSYIAPAMSGAGSVIGSVWSNKISPVFSAIKTGIGKVKDAFGTAASGIKTAWSKLEGYAKAPIKFVIQTVLNGGLIKAFNWLGGKIGGPHIDPIPLPFAQGGILPGYSPGRDIHQFYSPTGGSLALSGGEAIMRPEFTKAMGGKSGINRLNMLARQGMLTGDYKNGGVLGSNGSHAYGLGGVIDWIKKQPDKAFNWVGNKASAIWQALSHPLTYLKSKMPAMQGAGVIKDFAGSAANKLASSAASKVTNLFGDFRKGYDSIGGPIFGKMKTWIMNHLGIPYLWGGNGPRYDCSSFTQHASAAGGVQIPRTARTQQQFAHAVSSPKPGDLGFLGRPAHHVEMYMGSGKWAEAPHTGDVTKIISQALGGFTSFGRTFDNGGTLAPGLNLVRNNTGGPEPLIPAAAGGDTYINVTVSVDDLEKMTTVADFVDMLNNSRANGRRTQRSGRVTL